MFATVTPAESAGVDRGKVDAMGGWGFSYAGICEQPTRSNAASNEMGKLLVSILSIQLNQNQYQTATQRKVSAELM
ncbi:MAG: hypothetical protein Q8L02_06335 [Candidatus Nitrotoga sp.]|nr:hypothetical protein [Candidatus Nitrotoga sp.]